MVPTLDAAVADHSGLEVYVESLPRDERRPALLAALVGSRHHASLRTGGVRADLYPDEDEPRRCRGGLRAAVAFKATAGLHHAVRNTDPATGFEQHGFLNVILAVDAAHRGASTDEVAAILAERDADAVAARVARRLASAGVVRRVPLLLRHLQHRRPPRRA